MENLSLESVRKIGNVCQREESGFFCVLFSKREREKIVRKRERGIEMEIGTTNEKKNETLSSMYNDNIVRFILIGYSEHAQCSHNLHNTHNINCEL